MLRAALEAALGRRVVVIGGANTDVVGIANTALVARDSNPGHVRVSAGGVGRNIAENLARLGASVELITAFGGDAAGVQLRESCSAGTVGLAGSVTSTDLPGARYLAIAGPDGDMALALSDMRVIDLLTPTLLGSAVCRELLAAAELVVIDANLPAESIAWLASHVSVPLFAEPVSVAKSERLRPVLAHLAAMTPNALEAAQLLGEAVTDTREAAQRLVERGVGAAYVTSGESGSGWASADDAGFTPAYPVAVASTTGAGDAFAAGVAYAMLAGLDGDVAARVGTACSAVALASQETVSEHINLETVLEHWREEQS